MIFMIKSSAANNRIGSHSRFLTTRKEIEEGYALHIGENFSDHYPYQDEDGNWFVEIPTLERLMDIIDLFEEEIIIIPNYKGDFPTIEFYDDWRETSEMKHDCTPLK